MPVSQKPTLEYAVFKVLHMFVFQQIPVFCGSTPDRLQSSLCDSQHKHIAIAETISHQKLEAHFTH